MGKINRITAMAVLLSFAVVIHFIESIIPLPVPLPGVKLGLANIITLLVLLVMGFSPAMFVSLGRVALGGLLTGTFMGFGFWLSLGAAVVSGCCMAAMLPLLKKNYISVISVSITGAVLHNLTQLFLVGLIMQNMIIIRGYLPFLILAALPTGFLTGVAVLFLSEIIRSNSLMMAER